MHAIFLTISRRRRMVDHHDVKEWGMGTDVRERERKLWEKKRWKEKDGERETEY